MPDIWVQVSQNAQLVPGVVDHPCDSSALLCSLGIEILIDGHTGARALQLFQFPEVTREPQGSQGRSETELVTV